MMNSWPALQLAVQNGWGQDNRKKINKNDILSDEQLRENLINAFSNYILDYDASEKEVE